MMIDAHIHFWSYNAEEFGWIPDALASTRRSFLPAELTPLLRRSGVAAALAVQARQSVEETRWLLSIAATCHDICGVVGWLPLASRSFATELERIADPRLVGLRHVVKAEAEGFLLRPEIDAAFPVLARRGLAFDLLVNVGQLPEATALARRHRDVTFVLDHLGNPESHRGIAGLDAWRPHLVELASCENVYCKLSSGLCEDDVTWTPASLEPFFDAAIDAFGPRRLMFGSNWPVVHALGGYDLWASAVGGWALKRIGPDAEAVLADAVSAAYRLPEPRPGVPK